jgi:hypothetical protein
MFFSENDNIKRERDLSDLKQNWQQIIRVNKNGGKQLGITGGFRDVEIRVNNDTDYPLDKVTVLVRLQGIFNQCYTEKLTFEDIPANGEYSEYFTHTSCGQTLYVDVIGFKCHKLRYELLPSD